MSKINIPANSNPSLTLKSNPLQGLSSWLRHMAYKFPEDGPTLIDWAKEVAAVAAPTPPVDAVLGEPVAKLIVKREFHDNGQGPRDTEGYMMAIAVANSRAESLPIGDYALYIAAPVASRAVQAEASNASAVLTEFDRKLAELWGKTDQPYAEAYGWVREAWQSATAPAATAEPAAKGYP